MTLSSAAPWKPASPRSLINRPIIPDKDQQSSADPQSAKREQQTLDHNNVLTRKAACLGPEYDLLLLIDPADQLEDQCNLRGPIAPTTRHEDW